MSAMLPLVGSPPQPLWVAPGPPCGACPLWARCWLAGSAIWLPIWAERALAQARAAVPCQATKAHAIPSDWHWFAPHPHHLRQKARAGLFCFSCRLDIIFSHTDLNLHDGKSSILKVWIASHGPCLLLMGLDLPIRTQHPQGKIMMVPTMTTTTTGFNGNFISRTKNFESCTMLLPPYSLVGGGAIHEL